MSGECENRTIKDIQDDCLLAKARRSFHGNLSTANLRKGTSVIATTRLTAGTPCYAGPTKVHRICFICGEFWAFANTTQIKTFEQPIIL
jgi:hypothetical protein